MYCENMQVGLERWETRDKIIKIPVCRQKETRGPTEAGERCVAPYLWAQSYSKREGRLFAASRPAMVRLMQAEWAGAVGTENQG